MQLKYWLLILSPMIALTVLAQSEKCFATVPYECGDKPVNYLTAKEVKNLLKLQYVLERQRAEIEYLKSNSRADSCYIEELRSTINELTAQVNTALKAKNLSDRSYDSMVDAYAALKRQMRVGKVKSWAAGVAGSLGAFGAGVGVTFIILKTQ